MVSSMILETSEGLPSTPTPSVQQDGQTVRFLTEFPPPAAKPAIQMNLLFVTHSGSTKKGQEKDRREINRRAQQNAFLKRKQARRDASAQIPKSAPARTFGEFAHREDDTPEQTPPALPWPESSSLTTTISPFPDYDAPSVRSYLDSSRMDPLRSGKINMSPQMESVFMYYFTTIMPAVEPVLAEREGYNKWLVPLSLEEPALLYSLIGCMAYDIEQASVTGFGPSSRRNMVAERVQYRISAIQALNECLADPKTARKPSTLVAVHFLLWQEIFAGDECVHLDGVQRLLELRGGFDGVQRKAIEAIMVGSYWRAIRTRSKPMLPMVLDELPITESRFAEIISKCDPSIAMLGTGFLDPDIRQHFDEEMLQLLEDTRKAWVCFEGIGVHDFSPAEKRHVSIKRVNVDHRLLCYPFSHYAHHLPIQEACRQAIVVYSNAHYNVVQPSSKIARCLMEDLRAALEATDLAGGWGPARKALVWVCFVGAHMSFGQRERPWFVIVIARVVGGLGLRDWMQVRGLLTSFYYSDRVFQESFRNIWEEVGILTSIMPG